MSELARVEKGDVAIFQPEKTKERVSVLQAAIQHAKNMEDWESGWKAVDLMIKEQRAFVGWWDNNVQRPGGDRQSKHSPRSALMLLQDAERETGVKQQRVSKWRKQLGTGNKYREALFGAAHKKAMADEHNHRAQGTGENEWYTPAKYIEMARKVLGGIDLDPASSEEAQKTIQATKFFTAADNGLTCEWGGRVWLNPPYAQPWISEFVRKMVQERSDGRVDAAIMLTHNYTDTAWFHEAAEIADAICFTRGRIKFVDKDGAECAPTQGQAFFYYGDDISRFASVFVNAGFVMAHM